MHVGVLRIDIGIPHARSLKDKRQVVKSLKERLAHRFNCACAEVGDLESWTRASLGVSIVSNDREHALEVAQAIETYARNDANALIGNVETDVFEYGEM